MKKAFSPDTVQFQKEVSPQQAKAEPFFDAGPVYAQLQEQLTESLSPLQREQLETRSEQALLNQLATCFFLENKNLEAFQVHLRTLSQYLAPPLSVVFCEALAPWIACWQKRADALALKNEQAYLLACAEKSERTALPVWSPAFFKAFLGIEQYLLEQQKQCFSKAAMAKSESPAEPEEQLVRLSSTQGRYLLPNDVPLTVYQRSPDQWLRRAFRGLQLALKHNHDSHYLEHMVRALYAILAHNPQDERAILMLGWVHACSENREGALACLESLHLLNTPPATLSLIRFLQDPLLR